MSNQLKCLRCNIKKIIHSIISMAAVHRFSLSLLQNLDKNLRIKSFEKLSANSNPMTLLLAKTFCFLYIQLLWSNYLFWYSYMIWILRIVILRDSIAHERLRLRNWKCCASPFVSPPKKIKMANTDFFLRSNWYSKQQTHFFLLLQSPTSMFLKRKG